MTTKDEGGGDEDDDIFCLAHSAFPNERRKKIKGEILDLSLPPLLLLSGPAAVGTEELTSNGCGFFVWLIFPNKNFYEEIIEMPVLKTIL